MLDAVDHKRRVSAVRNKIYCSLFHLIIGIVNGPFLHICILCVCSHLRIWKISLSELKQSFYSASRLGGRLVSEYLITHN